MRWHAVATVLLVSAVACGQTRAPPVVTDPPPTSIAVTVDLAFVGDVMLGRAVGEIARLDPESIFADVDYTLSRADLTAANLESPLTHARHTSTNPNALEADPESAPLLADAGIDVVTIANNHAGDAGASGTTDTLEALRKAGVAAIGVADERASAIVMRQGLRIAMLAFDSSGTPTPGIVAWNATVARRGVAEARRRADIVTVALHGGAEYRPLRDPYLAALGRRLARWGVDVVWCHGSHVVQPIRSIDPDGDGRPTIVATSLGNFLFDQAAPGTRRGAILEVRAGADGVVAYRAAGTSDADLRVHFDTWRPPRGDAVVFDDEWWNAAASVPRSAPAPVPATLPSYPGDRWIVNDAAIGDVDGDGLDEVTVSYRWPYVPVPLTLRLPDNAWIDPRGMAAHVGVYRGEDLSPVWVASAIVRPVQELQPCGGGTLVAYSTLDDTAIVATGWWPWSGYGFVAANDLPGPGRLGCVDVDGDGLPDPVATERIGP
jgi:poly-gamma-glutamate capsule biosynthesis protein CapA/YwtB (metallophosphatase superfamily)